MCSCNYNHISPDLFQKEEIKSCEERVKKLLELTPPKGRTFLHKIEHILEREKNWVSMPPNLFSLSLSHINTGLQLITYSGYVYYLAKYLLNLHFLGMVETWWLPTIWKTTNWEESNTRWGQKAVWLLCYKLVISFFNSDMKFKEKLYWVGFCNL